jgi:dUTP pyrophosphatase
MKVVKLYKESKFEEKKEEDLGYDCYSVVLESDQYHIDQDGERCYIIEPGDIKRVSLGVKLLPNKGFGGFLKERSGKALVGLEVKGGVIDQYTGEFFAILKNGGKKNIRIYTGDKVCQYVIIKNYHEKVTFVEELEKTERGEKGFGSSDS